MHVMATPHLAYQVVGEKGARSPLHSHPQRFPIDLLWDGANPWAAPPAPPLRRFSRLILTDLLGVGSSDGVPPNDRPAMQSWTDGPRRRSWTRAGSECASIFSMSGASLPVMLLAASHPQRVRSLVLWSPFPCGMSAPPITPSGFPSRLLTRYLDSFRGRHRKRVRWSTFSGAQLGHATGPPSGVWWARQASGLQAAPDISTAIFRSVPAKPMAPPRCSRSIQAPTLVTRRRGDPRPSVTTMWRDPRRADPAWRGLLEFDGDDSVWFRPAMQIPSSTKIESFSDRRTQGDVVEPCAFRPCCSPTLSIRPSAQRKLGDEGLDDGTWRPHNPRRRAARGRFPWCTRQVSPAMARLATFDGPAACDQLRACAIRDAVGRHRF